MKPDVVKRFHKLSRRCKWTLQERERLLQQVGQLENEAHAIFAKAESEKRLLTKDELRQVQNIQSEIHSLQPQADRLTRAAEAGSRQARKLRRDLED